MSEAVTRLMHANAKSVPRAPKMSISKPTVKPRALALPFVPRNEALSYSHEMSRIIYFDFGCLLKEISIDIHWSSRAFIIHVHSCAKKPLRTILCFVCSFHSFRLLL